MNIEAIQENIDHMKEIIREAYIFTNQLDIIRGLEEGSRVVINTEEKNLLNNVIGSLMKQLIIINNSIPELVNNIGFYKKLDETKSINTNSKLIKVNYTPLEKKQKVSLTISEKEKKEFIENLSKSNLSMNQLKKKFSIEKPIMDIGKPSLYAKISNRFFRGLSYGLLQSGYFSNLNKSLRRINSQFVVGTYLSMVIMSMFLTFLISIFLYVTVVFFNIGLLFPFISPAEGDLLLRAVKYFWMIFGIPIATGVLMYYYPYSEGKNMGARIEQELPFVTIHMSAIATSGVEPISIFKIIIGSGDYKYTGYEFKKLMNLINLQGRDLVTALKEIAKNSPSSKLKELLDGMATSITSGGSLKQFLAKHSENLLFDYRLERERYTKTSETFMDIYISIVIAAPMILLMLFVIMSSTGTLYNFIGLGIDVINLLIILVIALINVGFLVFLRLKQPSI